MHWILVLGSICNFIKKNQVNLEYFHSFFLLLSNLFCYFHLQFTLLSWIRFLIKKSAGSSKNECESRALVGRYLLWSYWKYPSPGSTCQRRTTPTSSRRWWRAVLPPGRPSQRAQTGQGIKTTIKYAGITPVRFAVRDSRQRCLHPSALCLASVVTVKS